MLNVEGGFWATTTAAARSELCQCCCVVLCDTRGVIYRGRSDGMNQWKSAHAIDTKARSLAEAIERGCEVIDALGLPTVVRIATGLGGCTWRGPWWG